VVSPFGDRLTSAIREKKAPVCVGFDPLIERLPPSILAESGITVDKDSGVDANVDLGAAADALRSFGRDLISTVAPYVPAVQSDRGQLQQVFLNIINNAMAAVSDGGKIDIEIGAEEERGVSVEIVDNGVGIPREHLNRIFEPFFTTKKGSGTGLGLSITYGIVKKLGGDISVESLRGPHRI